MAFCDVPDTPGAAQGQSRAAHVKHNFKDREKKDTLRNSITAGWQVGETPLSLFPQRPGLQAAWDSPESGRGQKCSAPEGTSWPASWRSCCSSGTIPTAVGGAFSGMDSCNTDTCSPGPQDPALLPQSNRERRHL